MRVSEVNVWLLGEFKPAPTQLAFPSHQRHQRLSYLGTRSELEIAYAFSHWARVHLDRPVEADVRSPNHKYSLAYAPEGDTLWGWHHDMDSGLSTYLLSWSNGIGTEVRDPATGKYFQAEPFHVIGFNNSACEHRAPPRIHHKDRWFVRALLPADFVLPDDPNIRPATPISTTNKHPARSYA